MTNTTANNKRIAKNTLLLYFRMLLILIVSLFTSRIVLKILGVNDYGIYNVVGGVIAIFSSLNTTMSGASSRFLSYSIGKEDKDELSHVFSTILYIHYILALIILIIGETIGLWFLHNQLAIPEDRILAASWVYQCSLLSAIISVISSPYNSLLIAHEKMNIFASISILEALLKLTITVILCLLPYDKLIVYSILLLLIQLIIRIIYNLYCKNHFPESKLIIIKHSKNIKKIISYISWTLNGNLAIVGSTQGVNILLNIFFGPAVNAARGLSVQVQSAVRGFITGFQTSVKPQIIKYYARHDIQNMHTLLIRSSKYGFFLALILSFPLIVYSEQLLRIWLHDVPDYTNVFVKIILCIGLIEPLKFNLDSAIQATGYIKKYQIYISLVLLSVLPFSYLFLKYFNATPVTVLWIYAMTELTAQVIRTQMVLYKIEMPILFYLRQVLYPIIKVLVFSISILIILPSSHDLSIAKVLLSIILNVVYLCIIIYYIGLNKTERHKIIELFFFKNSSYFT